MSFSCFDNFVGLRGVCDDPGSKLYINDLPGITLRKFANTANEEDITGSELFTRLNREACLQTAEDFLAVLSDQTQFKSVLDIDVIGGWDNDYRRFYYEQEDCMVGIEIWSQSTDPMVSIGVDWIEIRASERIKKKIYIETFEGDRATKEVILEKGRNQIPIDFKGDFVRISLNKCNISLQRESGCDCYGSNDTCDRCSCACVQYRYVQRCSDDLPTNSPDCWEHGSEMPFLVCVRCCCDMEKFICKYRNELKYAARWKIAALLMEETIYTDRRNPLVRNSKQEAERYLAKIVGGEDPATGMTIKSPEYWRALKQAKKRTNSAYSRSKCLACSGDRIVYSLP